MATLSDLGGHSVLARNTFRAIKRMTTVDSTNSSSIKAKGTSCRCFDPARVHVMNRWDASNDRRLVRETPRHVPLEPQPAPTFAVQHHFAGCCSDFCRNRPNQT